MTIELLLLCTLAALLELDTTYVFQLTFSRGLIAGPIFACLSGDWVAGIQAGVFTELLFADVNPLGTILPPSAVVCCAVSLGLHMGGTEMCLAFIWGVLGALLFSFVEQHMRRVRANLLGMWENKIMQRPSYIKRVMLMELSGSFLVTFVFLLLFTWGAGQIMLWLQPHISVRALFACRFAYMAVPWIGLASLLPEFRLKRR